MKKILIVIASAGLLVGCQKSDSGGTGTSSDTSVGAGSSWSRSKDTNMPSSSQGSSSVDTNNVSRDRTINK
jgi:hypothetical protein